MMTAREHLQQYGEAVRRDERLKEELEIIRAHWTSPSIVISDMPHGSGGSHDLSEYAAIVDDILRELKDNIEEAQVIRHEIMESLRQMDSKTEREVLYCRYVCLMKWEDVAEKIPLEYRYVFKVHNKALRHYPVPTAA